MESTCEVNPLEKNLGWTFVLFIAHSFPACLLVIYLTHSRVTFLCKDQPYFVKLRISDNWEALTEHIKLPCPSQLPLSWASRALVIPRDNVEWGCHEGAGGYSPHNPAETRSALWATWEWNSAWGPLLLLLSRDDRLRQASCASRENWQGLPATTLSPLFFFSHFSPLSLLNLCNL